MTKNPLAGLPATGSATHPRARLLAGMQVGIPRLSELVSVPHRDEVDVALSRERDVRKVLQRLLVEGHSGTAALTPSAIDNSCDVLFAVRSTGCSSEAGRRPQKEERGKKSCKRRVLDPVKGK